MCHSKRTPNLSGPLKHGKSSNKEVNFVDDQDLPAEKEDVSYCMYINHSPELITISVNLSGHDINMIVYTGKSKSILSEQIYKQLVSVDHRVQLEIYLSHLLPILVCP